MVAILQITSETSLMSNRKSVGPKMEPWGTQALTRYSCEYFPSKTTQSRQLFRKDKIMPNIWPEIPLELSLWRRACKTLSRALVIKYYSSSSLRPIKSSLVVLSDTTIRRLAVNREDLIPYLKSEKRPHFSGRS